MREDAGALFEFLFREVVHVGAHAVELREAVVDEDVIGQKQCAVVGRAAVERFVDEQVSGRSAGGGKLRRTPARVRIKPFIVVGF